MITDMAREHQDDVLRAEIRVGRQGRIVIPAPLRRALGYQEGDELIAYILEGQLVISTRDAIMDLVRGSVEVEPGRSVVDELIAERRQEARREEKEERAWLEERSTHRRSSR